MLCLLPSMSKDMMQVLVLGKSQYNMHVRLYFCQSLFKGGYIGNCNLPAHTWKRKQVTNEHALMPWINALMHGITQNHLQSSEGPELCSRVVGFSLSALSVIFYSNQARFYLWQHFILSSERSIGLRFVTRALIVFRIITCIKCWTPDHLEKSFCSENNV